MPDPEIRKSAKPQIGTDIKSDLANKILNRLQHIGRSKKTFAKNEKVLGIFKCNGFPIGHIVITDYRILGVKTAESHGNVVFAKELIGKDIQSILLQAKDGWLWRGDYDVELDKDGKKSKYAIVKSVDVDNIVKLLEKVKSSESLTLLTEAQEQLATEEKAERDRVDSEKKQQKKAKKEKAKKEKEANKLLQEKEK